MSTALTFRVSSGTGSSVSYNAHAHKFFKSLRVQLVVRTVKAMSRRIRMWEHSLVLKISLAILLVHVHAQTSNTTGTTPVSSSTSIPENSPPVASLVGFCVVVSLLVVSVCVVMLIISKYGPKKCPCTTSMSMHRRTASSIPVSSPRPPQENPFHYPQQQKLQQQHITHDSDQLQEPQEGVQGIIMHTRQLSNSSLQPSMSMLPQLYPPSASIPPLQTRPMTNSPHFRGVGYPYQPCKSPRTPHSIIHHSFDFQPPRGRPPPSQPTTPCQPGVESNESTHTTEV